MAELGLTVNAKRALEGLTEKEIEKALEILKAINGMEVSRADKILTFCKETARSTAITDTKDLSYIAQPDDSMGQKVVPNYICCSESGKA